jgi:cytochrome c-type biogenesis protein CcmH
MRRLVLIVALLSLAVAAAAPAPAGAAQAKASLNDIESEVMCVECGTPLSVSQSPAADGERRFIQRRIAEGKTKDQIKAALVAEYGRNVLGTPPDKGFARAVYIVPIALAAAAAAALLLAARRWRRRSSPQARTPEGSAPLSDDDAQRLERDMASYEL